MYDLLKLCGYCPYQECIGCLCWVYRFRSDIPGEEREKSMRAEYDKYKEFLSHLSPETIAEQITDIYKPGIKTHVFVNASGYQIETIQTADGYQIIPKDIKRHRLIVIPGTIPPIAYPGYIREKWHGVLKGLDTWNNVRLSEICHDCTDYDHAGSAGFPLAVNACNGCPIKFFWKQIGGGE